MTKESAPKKIRSRKNEGGMPFISPVKYIEALKRAEALLEIETRKQAAAFANLLIERHGEHWQEVNEAVKDLPADQQTKIFKKAYVKLKLYHRIKDENLVLEWVLEHKKKSGKGKSYKHHLRTAKGGKSYDTGMLKKYAGPKDAELVKDIELECRRIRAMWDGMKELREFAARWVKLTGPNMVGIDTDKLGNWTLGPSSLTSEYGIEQLTLITGVSQVAQVSQVDSGDSSDLEVA